MSLLPRSLHVRLASGLFLLLLLTGAVNLASTLVTTRLYMNEVSQTMNLRLAENIASMKQDRLVSEDGTLEREGVEQLLHWMMVVNPGPHFYILDLRGRILTYDPSAGEPQTTMVSLAPIREFLDRLEARGEAPREPIFGDDPREPDSRKVFSVALLEGPSKPVGYLYVVLNSQLTDSVAEDLRGSYILRLGLRNALAYGTAALLIGLIASLVFTRPLRRLARRMEDFQVDEIPAEPPNLLLPAAPASLPQAAAAGAAAHDASSSAIPAPHPAASGDEVRLLETRFEEMAERLRRRVDHSEQIADFRRELMANISHDLRTPIATLRGYLETLCLRGGVLSEKQREEYLGIALKHSERLGRLVDELIELSKLEGREMQPSLDRFRLGELIQDNVQRFRLRAEEKGITLQADFNPDLPPVYADVGLMERALENLIENALRHTEAGGTVTVRLRKEPAELVLSVSDTGCGIAEEDLPYIFDRFYRSKLTAAGEGVGLGLAITQRIAQLHGGSLEVESQLGKGSVFSFSLEIAPLTYQLMAEDLNGLTSVTGPMTRRSLQ